MSNVLDLSGADDSAFDPIPSGAYPAVVFEAAMTETKGGPEAKLPAGTPMLKVQFKITHEDYDNRRAFTNYVFPPEDYDQSKAAKLKGNLVRFLTALGYDRDKIVSGKFKLDVEELVGKECTVVLGQQEYNGETTNNVKGVKPAGELVGGSGSGLL